MGKKNEVREDTGGQESRAVILRGRQGVWQSEAVRDKVMRKERGEKRKEVVIRRNYQSS